VAKDELECFGQVRQLLSFLPQNNAEKPPVVVSSDPPDRALPILDLFCEVDRRTAYQVRHVIWMLADDNIFLEVHPLFAPNISVGFLRLGGKSVGIVANDPAHLSGALDINSADKAARFVRFLDAFNIPILTLVDVPGYWPGLEQEQRGLIRHGAKLLYAYAEATVAKVTVVMRKAYGGAYVAMGSKHLGGDFNFALPSAEMAVMGPDGAVKILYSREISSAPTPEERKAVKEKLTKEYSEQFATPYEPAAHGAIDEVIEPTDLRRKVVRAFEFLEDKRRPGSQDNHRNIPL
jgi:propionyl-CoA carboxylase beta chain